MEPIITRVLIGYNKVLHYQPTINTSLLRIENTQIFHYISVIYVIMQTALCKLHNAVCIISKNIRIFAAGNYRIIE